MNTWTYPACVMAGNHDGDTLFVDIDLGMDLMVKRKTVRLYGIACNELSAAGGPEARDAVAERVPIGTPISLVSRGWDKYSGRIDALVYLDPRVGLTLNSWLVMQGWAVPWNGTGKQPYVVYPPIQAPTAERIW